MSTLDLTCSQNPAQLEFMDALLGGGYHRILWIQSVRQGKTAGCVIGMVKHAMLNSALGIGNDQYLLGHVSTGLLLDTQLEYWEDVGEQLDMPLRVTHEPRAKIRLGPWLFHLAGGDNEGSAHRIQGLTITSAWLDEVVELKESFIETAYDRCSFGGSVLIMTGNAGAAGHFLEERYISNPAGPPKGTYLMVDGGVTDNGYIEPERVERYINDTARDPVHYNRKVMNVWAADTGLVFTIEDAMTCDPVVEQPRGFISVDPGIAGTTAMLRWIPQGRDWVIADEVYHRRASAEAVVSGELLDRAVESRGWQTREVVVDPAALREMKERLSAKGYRVIPANNDVELGIRTVNHRLIEGRLKMSRSCPELRRECNMYKWNKYEQKPVKEFDHGPDSMRYGAMHAMPLTRNSVVGL